MKCSLDTTNLLSTNGIIFKHLYWSVLCWNCRNILYRGKLLHVWGLKAFTLPLVLTERIKWVMPLKAYKTDGWQEGDGNAQQREALSRHLPKSGLDSAGDCSDQKELIGPLPFCFPEKWSIIFQHFKCFLFCFVLFFSSKMGVIDVFRMIMIRGFALEICMKKRNCQCRLTMCS